MLVRAIVLLALVAGATAAELRPQAKPINFCQGCRSLVSFVRAFNNSNDREQNRDVVQNFCELHYPASTDFQQGPCPIFVEGFFYVVDHMDPVHHCDQIGACGKATEESFAMMPAHNQHGMSSKGANVVCDFCEQVVEQTQATLANPTVVETVRRQIDSLCDYLLVVGQDKQCKQLLHQYLDQAVDFVKTIDPLNYCRSISMCPKDQRARLASSVPKTLPTLTDFNNFGIETSVTIGHERAKDARNAYDVDLAITSHKSGPNCMLCKTVVKELFHFVRDNRTEENIMRGLDQVCKLIYRRGTSFEQCESMVKAYTKEIIQLLIDETDPEMICMLLEQCHYDPGVTVTRKEIAPVQPTVVSANRTSFGLGNIISSLDSSIGLGSARACLECKLFIKFLRNELEDEKSQESMKVWLVANLCGKLPDKDMVESCTKMVDDYSDTFFKAVAGTLNEKEACAELGACKERLAHKMIIDVLTGEQKSVLSAPSQSGYDRWARAQLRAQKARRVRGQLCDNCIKIVTEIDEYLSTHSVNQDVQVLIDQVCNKLPDGAGRTECTFIVKYFGSEIIQIISSMHNPRQVCSKIYQC